MLLCNICHGFSVRSWWPRVLCQAATCDEYSGRWQCVGAVRSNRCVTGRRPRDNHALRFAQRQRIESRARDTLLIRGFRSSLTIRLARGYKRWHPLAPGRRYGTRRSPLLWVCLHQSLKVTTNCGPLSRIKWGIYFCKEMCSVSSLNFVNHVWLSIQQCIIARTGVLLHIDLRPSQAVKIGNAPV